MSIITVTSIPITSLIAAMEAREMAENGKNKGRTGIICIISVSTPLNDTHKITANALAVTDRRGIRMSVKGIKEGRATVDKGPMTRGRPASGSPPAARSSYERWAEADATNLIIIASITIRLSISITFMADNAISRPAGRRVATALTPDAYLRGNGTMAMVNTSAATVVNMIQDQWSELKVATVTSLARGIGGIKRRTSDDMVAANNMSNDRMKRANTAATACIIRALTIIRLILHREALKALAINKCSSGNVTRVSTTAASCFRC